MNTEAPHEHQRGPHAVRPTIHQHTGRPSTVQEIRISFILPRRREFAVSYLWHRLQLFLPGGTHARAHGGREFQMGVRRFRRLDFVYVGVWASVGWRGGRG